MKIGIIGLGVVGGTLRDFLVKFTSHELKLCDPPKGKNDDFEGIDVCFVSVPVHANGRGQDQRVLKNCIEYARKYTQNIFIRSTVLPGTNDSMGTMAMPEFLTERQAFEDMQRLPILAGYGGNKTSREVWELLSLIFPNKEIIVLKNSEAELAKFAHNCFGAMKVTYFNMIYKMCQAAGADFEAVKFGASLTGFIEMAHHTKVPGPDGMFGFGGKCFPENVKAFEGYAEGLPGFEAEKEFLRVIQWLNFNQRFVKRENEAHI